MEAELAALAASGATTLVGVMVSDSWNQVKHRLSTFFARDGAAQVVSEELEVSRGELVEAREAGDEDSASDVEAAWRVRLRRMLQNDPAAAEELRSLLAELAPKGWSVSNSISGGVYNAPVVQVGTVSVLTNNLGAPAPSAERSGKG